MGKRKPAHTGATPKQKFHITSNLVESLELPKDLMYGAVLVTVTGNTEMLVENYRGIIEYTSERIRVQTKNCQVQVQGQQLLIAYYTNDEMKITGNICQIQYL